MPASKTLLFVFLEGRFLPQDNTHFEHHSNVHYAGELVGADALTICCTYHLIVTVLNEALSWKIEIFAVAFDNVVKPLCRRNE